MVPFKMALYLPPSKKRKKARAAISKPCYCTVIYYSVHLHLLYVDVALVFGRKWCVNIIPIPRSFTQQVALARLRQAAAVLCVATEIYISISQFTRGLI